MRFRGPIFFSILIVGLIFAAFYPPVDTSEKEAVLIHTIMNGLKRFHYAPVEIDDAFSGKAFALYLERTDPGKRWLTAADLRQLEAYKDDIDNESNAGTYKLFDLSQELLRTGIDRSQAYYREALAEPFDFSVEDSYQLDPEKRSFAKNEKELKQQWYQMMKYEVLTRLDDKLDAQQEGTDEELVGKSFAELEAQSREEVLKVFDDWYVRLGKRTRNDNLNTYLNVLTNVFDPHTGYFEPIEKENFDISMSGKLEGIGARLVTDGEFTKVNSIVVGGPAWKQGELEENDKIVKVKQEGEESADVTGWGLDEVVQLIRGKKGTKVQLTVKKVDGTVQTIGITRDVVILEEGFAKSLLLETPAQEKIGYIRLPRFYDDFSNDNGRSCAEDVESEIEKLKNENVAGIILDLRNNGGGSLRDVVTMTGLFIEDGPIVQVKSRDRTADILEDTDPRVQWDGNLIIMVNQYSASASEILAAALQDYGRAVIVGTSSTFGKGTVQRFFDLDRSIAGFNEVKPLGSIKLTTQKFYRVTGGSTQLKGVVPDIVFPYNYEYIETGEKEHDFPLEWTEISPVDYTQTATTTNYLGKLKEMSAYRTSNDEMFQAVHEHAKQLKLQQDQSAYSLNLEKFQLEEEKLQAKMSAYDKLFEQEIVPGVSNLTADWPAIESDESKKARNEEWMEDIKKDLYLKETLQIMQDMIDQQ